MPFLVRENEFRCHDFLLVFFRFVFWSESAEDDFFRHTDIPGGLFSHSCKGLLFAGPLLMAAQQAQCNFHHPGIIFSRVAHPFPTGVFSKNDIKRPMHALDLPMIANRMRYVHTAASWQTAEFNFGNFFRGSRIYARKGPVKDVMRRDACGQFWILPEKTLHTLPHNPRFDSTYRHRRHPPLSQ